MQSVTTSTVHMDILIFISVWHMNMYMYILHTCVLYGIWTCIGILHTCVLYGFWTCICILHTCVLYVFWTCICILHTCVLYGIWTCICILHTCLFMASGHVYVYCIRVYCMLKGKLAYSIGNKFFFFKIKAVYIG